MGYAIAFGIVWAILAVLIILLLAAVPSNETASNGDLLVAVAIAGVVSAAGVLIASGVINLFT
jgi:hypothetical protein